MKFLTTLISALSAEAAENSLRTLGRLVAILVVAVAAFSIGFHEVMALEGREFSWTTSVYWTVVTMTTLGYGDITFVSDLGRMYSLLVLLVGSILILVLLPFTFIQVVYLPWRAATRQAGAPRSLPDTMTGHVLLTAIDPVADALIQRLDAADVPYVVLVEDVEHALSLHDEGYRVAVGALDDPDTYRRVRADRAAMLFTARGDQANTNIVFTLREVAPEIPVVATARSIDAVDILELVGAHVALRPGEVLGEAFARRTLQPSARSSVVASFHGLVVAEASAAGTDLVGQALAELRLRQRFGITVAGLLERGALELGTPSSVVGDNAILVLIGTEQQIARYNQEVDPGLDDDGTDVPDGRVVLLGGGRVGRAAARTLHAAGTTCCVVEREPTRSRVDGVDYVIGDAADRDVLARAGIEDAFAVLVTTHDDDTNIYLTLYCRRLRPDIEILGRVNNDRNLGSMHRAGADLALSYASTGAAEVWNVLRGHSTLLLAEGLLLFRAPVGRRLGGRVLGDTRIRAETGCNVVGLVIDGRTSTEIGPDTLLPHDSELVLVGTNESEERFLRRYVADRDDDGAGARLRALLRWREND